MTQTVSTTLNLAADLIEERGWATGNSAMRVDDDGLPLCLEGGIAAASGIRATHEVCGFVIADYAEVSQCPAYKAVHNYLSSRPDDEFTSGTRQSREPWGWNDANGRTAAEVIEVLRATAVIEAARESETEAASAALVSGGVAVR